MIKFRFHSGIYSHFYFSPFGELGLRPLIHLLANTHWSQAASKKAFVTFKHILPSIIIPIYHLINRSFELGVFPQRLKLAHVIALFKGGDRKDPGNYRPISLLSVFSRIFERAMLKRLVRFLEAKFIFHQHQFGFCAKYSTEHACDRLLQFIRQSLDSNLIPAAIFLDVKKVFDSQIHKILIGKLCHIGVHGESLTWFSSYLTDRSITTEVTDEKVHQ